jgi:hypothetical protein
MASSGSSSSSSSHSASLSLTVFRFASCHDCLLEFSPGEGKLSRFRELLRESVRGAEGKPLVLEGDGERDERLGAARPRLVRDGADGEVKPLLSCFPGAVSCDCCLWTAWWTCPFRVGYLGFVVLVRSRKEVWECDRLRPPATEGREPSKMMRSDGLNGAWNPEGPAAASSRLMSSKCERSLVPIKSVSVDECRLLDLDDLEFVRSGGLPGGIPKLCASCGNMSVVISGRGGRRCSRRRSVRGEESRRAHVLRFGGGINEWT